LQNTDIIKKVFIEAITKLVYKCILSYYYKASYFYLLLFTLLVPILGLMLRLYN